MQNLKIQEAKMHLLSIRRCVNGVEQDARETVSLRYVLSEVRTRIAQLEMALETLSEEVRP